MRGVNLGGWFSQIDCIQEKDPDRFPGVPVHIETFLAQEDFDRIKGWGFDHVRLPVDYFNVFKADTPGLEPNEPMLALLDGAIERLTATGLEVILDLHKCPGHDFLDGCSRAQSFFTDPAKRNQAMRVWSHLAERYGTNPSVLLEILNEPIAEDSRSWNEVKDELAMHVRRHAPRSTLVVGSNRWNHPREFAHLTPVNDDNVLYSFHFYAPLLFTHQRAAWLSGDVFRVSRPYPGEYSVPEGTTHRLPLDLGRWDRARIEHRMEDVFRFRDRYHVPVGCQEFGVFVGGAVRESQLRWMNDLLSVFDEHGVGWSYWNYKNLDFGLISKGERLFAQYERYSNPKRIDQRMVQTLRSHGTKCRYR